MESQLEVRAPPYLRDRYRRDPAFRSRVDYASQRGIPLSVFLGRRTPKPTQTIWIPPDRWQQIKNVVTANPATSWGRRVRTRAEINPDRLTGELVEIEGEPEWMAEDREVALMWAEEQQLVCPTCATADWEWEEDENAYYPDLWTCHGCKRKAELRRQVTIDLDGQPPGAADGLQLRWFKTPRDPDAAT